MATQSLKPLRYTVRNAAVVLNVSPHQVRILAKAGTLTPIFPDGQGQGKKTYLIPAEVEAYATRGLAGVVAYRKKHAKKK